jgi:hypothetical protein
LGAPAQPTTLKKEKQKEKFHKSIKHKQHYVKINPGIIRSSKAFEELIINNTVATDVINLKTASTKIVVHIQGALADALAAQPEPPKADVDLNHTTQQHPENNTSMSDNSFFFALNNVIDEIAMPTSEILKEMLVLEMVTCDQQEVTSQEADSDAHDSKHRCPIVNKDLDIFQKVLRDLSNNTVEPFTPHVSKAQKEKEN